jgi:hypothetical protein
MIYVIQRGDNGPIKIGLSENPERRLKQLQTGNGEPLRLIAVIEGNRRLEQEIHSTLHNHQGIGEWFMPDDRELAYIQRLMNIEYEINEGKPYAVLHRSDEHSLTERCPFCCDYHSHGTFDGHRIAHCVRGWSSLVTTDGTILNRSNGYIIRSGRRNR